MVKGRPRDKILNAGIGCRDQKENAKLYIMSARVLKTFSMEDTLRIDAEGTYRIVDEYNVQLIPINILFENYIKHLPDFVTIDVEGLDYQILKSLDLRKHRPPVFCVETLEFRMNREGKKVSNIIKLFENNEYFPFADTHLNTIFVDKKIW